MDPEDIPTGFPNAGPDEPLTEEEQAGIDDIRDRVQAALCTGPQCASSVLATRYAKILRQERLLAMAASALDHFETMLEGKVLTPQQAREASAPVERSRAIRRQIDEEKGNPA